MRVCSLFKKFVFGKQAAAAALAGLVDQLGWSLESATALQLIHNSSLIMPAINPDTKLPACMWIAAAAASYKDTPTYKHCLPMLQLALEAHHDHVVLAQTQADGSASVTLQSCLR
jgi:hypothetical protein